MVDKSYTNKKSGSMSVSASGAKSSGGKKHENDFVQGQADSKFTSKRQFGGKVKRN